MRVPWLRDISQDLATFSLLQTTLAIHIFVDDRKKKKKKKCGQQAKPYLPYSLGNGKWLYFSTQLS
jgi:hypothetical protein